MERYQKRERRLDLHRPLTVILDSEIARVRNMSLSGCLLQTRKWLKVGQTKYDFCIRPQGHNEITTLCRIVRAKMVQDETGPVYEIGIKFVNVDTLRSSEPGEFKAWLSALLQTSDPDIRLT